MVRVYCVPCFGGVEEDPPPVQKGGVPGVAHAGVARELGHRDARDGAHEPAQVGVAFADAQPLGIDAVWIAGLPQPFSLLLGQIGKSLPPERVVFVTIIYVLVHPFKDGLHLLGVGGLAGGKAVGELHDLLERVLIGPLDKVASPGGVAVKIRLFQRGGAGGPVQLFGQRRKYLILGQIAPIVLGGGGRDGQTQTHHKGQRKG